MDRKCLSRRHQEDQDAGIGDQEVQATSRLCVQSMLGEDSPLQVPLRTSVTVIAQSCPTLCDPVDCSTPGLPVHHQLPELAHTHVQSSQ